MIDQVGRDIDLDAKRDIAGMTSDPFDPVEQHGLPQTDFAADRQDGLTTRRHRDLVARTLP